MTADERRLLAAYRRLRRGAQRLVGEIVRLLAANARNLKKGAAS